MLKLKMLSLFSGIGAFEQALKNIGVDYELINFCEIDKYASKAYCLIHNENEEKNLKDVTRINIDNLPNDIDLLTHGSPCQSFSSVGKQEGGDKGSGTKSSLMWYSVEIIKHKMPKIVVWENVKNVLSQKHKHNFDKYINELDKLGYHSYYKVINAKDMGVPQNRERIFVISLLDDKKFIFPQKKQLTKTLKDYIDEKVDEKYIVPYNNMKNFCSNNEMWSKRTKIKSLDEVANCLVAKGGRTCRTNNYIFYDIEDYNRCQYENNEVLKIINEGYKIRALTPKEYFRLMGFTDEQFEKVNGKISDAQLYKQAGNSIVVNVLEAIFKNLFKD